MDGGGVGWGWMGLDGGGWFSPAMLLSVVLAGLVAGCVRSIKIDLIQEWAARLRSNIVLITASCDACLAWNQRGIQ